VENELKKESEKAGSVSRPETRWTFTVCYRAVWEVEGRLRGEWNMKDREVPQGSTDSLQQEQRTMSQADLK
jgi:hypothetical protein